MWREFGCLGGARQIGAALFVLNWFVGSDDDVVVVYF
jgi:hypothetical protein